MNKITTYEDLLHEKQRLQLQLEVNKAAVKGHVDTIKKKLNPLKGVVSFFSNFTAPASKNTLLGTSLNFSLELLIRKLFFAKAGFITRLVGPILLKNFGTNVIKNKKTFLKRFKSIFQSNGKTIKSTP